MAVTTTENGQPVANLPSIDINLLQAQDAAEYQRLLSACEVYGFFYLNLQGYGSMVADWQKVLELMGEYFAQPLDVKMLDARHSDTHGYEPCGTSAGAREDEPDHYESLKVSRAEMTNFDEALPQLAKDNSELFERFTSAAHNITMTILDALSTLLELDEAHALRNYHRDGEPSLSTMSMFRYPKQERYGEGVGHNKHTDLGTLTFLLTTQWGLQVLSPECNEWRFIAPRPDHAIINVADSLRFLSGFRLKSAVHQVLPMHGLQHEHRYSIAYFLRAEDNVQYKDSQGRVFTAKQWHDTKFDVFRESHDKQAQDSILTGGMERGNSIVV
ncbi:gibberellin 20-oxidase [Phlyctema vagabunda]|uniref:Gibberellin 20-oxidase n=1 Tax=Phlyctema vagabunda TaxID=108571 RepID=A0ABR4PB11_9HELO